MSEWLLWLLPGMWAVFALFGIVKKWSATVAIGGGFIAAIFTWALVVGVLQDNPSTAELPTEPESPQELVYNSAWDGSVRQVEQWLRDNLKDPGSLDVITWGKVVKLDNDFLVRCKYRARNGFGGYAIEDQVFYISAAGEVTGVIDAGQL